ncbi:MAG: hypothetical protein ACJAVZ_000408 [Afipia broomeae]
MSLPGLTRQSIEPNGGPQGPPFCLAECSLIIPVFANQRVAYDVGYVEFVAVSHDAFRPMLGAEFIHPVFHDAQKFLSGASGNPSVFKLENIRSLRGFARAGLRFSDRRYSSSWGKQNIIRSRQECCLGVQHAPKNAQTRLKAITAINPATAMMTAAIGHLTARIASRPVAVMVKPKSFK